MSKRKYTNTQFTNIEITKSIKQIIGRLTTLSILAQILDPFFCDYILHDAYLSAHPIHWGLTQLIHHMYGQMARCWFDQAKGKYKTISVCVLYEQIRHSEKYNNFTCKQKETLRNVRKKIISNSKKYEKKLRNFADKYHHHNEKRTQKQRHKEFDTLDVSWNDIKILLDDAKMIINAFYSCWNKKTSDFEENHYKFFREGFCLAINPKILKERPKK